MENLHLGKITRYMVSVMAAMAAGNAIAGLHQFKLHMFCAALHYTNHALCMISVRILLHDVYYNQCKNIELLCFRYFPWDFPASRGLICCLYNVILCYQLLQFMVISYTSIYYHTS